MFDNKKKKYRAGTALILGVATLYLLSIAVGAVAVLGWLKADGDIVSRGALAILAGVAALVVPLLMLAVGRNGVSFALLPVAVFFMAVTGWSTHNAYDSLVEKPRMEAHAQQAASLKARWVASEAAVEALKIEVLTCRCPETRKAARQTWADQRTALLANAERAKLAYEANPYTPAADTSAVWIVSGLLDLAIALGIWGLEATSRADYRKHVAKQEERQAARQRAKQKADRKVAKPAKKQPAEVVTDAERFRLFATGPKLVVSN